MVRPTSNESICVHRKSGVLVTLLHPIPDRQVGVRFSRHECLESGVSSCREKREESILEERRCVPWSLSNMAYQKIGLAGTHQGGFKTEIVSYKTVIKTVVLVVCLQ